MTIEDDQQLEFKEKSRSIRLREKHRVCEKGNYETYGYTRGNQLYSTGLHQIKFTIEKIETTDNKSVEWSPWIFVGICSATDRSANGDVRYHKLRSAYGWSTNGDVWENGFGKRVQWSGVPIENDILILTINCDQRTISLFNERTRQKTKDIKIDLQDKTQFPWCFYLVIANQGYRIRLL